MGLLTRFLTSWGTLEKTADVFAAEYARFDTGVPEHERLFQLLRR